MAERTPRNASSGVTWSASSCERRGASISPAYCICIGLSLEFCMGASMLGNVPMHSITTTTNSNKTTTYRVVCSTELSWNGSRRRNAAPHLTPNKAARHDGALCFGHRRRPHFQTPRARHALRGVRRMNSRFAPQILTPMLDWILLASHRNSLHRPAAAQSGNNQSADDEAPEVVRHNHGARGKRVLQHRTCCFRRYHCSGQREDQHGDGKQQ